MMRPSLSPMRGWSLPLIGIVVALGACASSAPTRYFALETIGPFATQPAPLSTYSGPRIDLRSVQIPPAMDRLELVQELSAGELRLREFDHWAAPLSRLARQTLAEDLSHRLPDNTMFFGGSASNTARAELTVEVLSFHLLDGNATMTLNWSLRSHRTTFDTANTSATPSNVMFDSMRLSVPAVDTASGLERAWSELLAQAADRIAESLSAP